LAHVENNSDKQHAKRVSVPARLLLATAALCILLPCLGLLGSGAYLRARQAGAFSRWQSLGAPPGRAVNIVTGDLDVVYVRTAAGVIHGCVRAEAYEPVNCWGEAQEPLLIDPEARFDERLYAGEVKPPAGTVVDTLSVAVWYAEDAYETHYALLEDGTVWKWEYDTGGYWSLLILVLGPLAGLAAGIAVSVVLWVGVGLRSSRQRRQQAPHENV
jgi:hypothetical protein